MHSFISSCSFKRLPGSLWNIISTEGEPKVQPPSLRILMAGRDICLLALRWKWLIFEMSLYIRKLVIRSHSPKRFPRSSIDISVCLSMTWIRKSFNFNISWILRQLNIQRISTKIDNGWASKSSFGHLLKKFNTSSAFKDARRIPASFRITLRAASKFPLFL